MERVVYRVLSSLNFYRYYFSREHILHDGRDVRATFFRFHAILDVNENENGRHMANHFPSVPTSRMKLRPKGRLPRTATTVYGRVFPTMSDRKFSGTYRRACHFYVLTSNGDRNAFCLYVLVQFVRVGRGIRSKGSELIRLFATYVIVIYNSCSNHVQVAISNFSI